MKIGTYASKFKNCIAFMESSVIPKGFIIIDKIAEFCIFIFLCLLQSVSERSLKIKFLTRKS